MSTAVFVGIADGKVNLQLSASDAANPPQVVVRVADIIMTPDEAQILGETLITMAEKARSDTKKEGN